MNEQPKSKVLIIIIGILLIANIAMLAFFIVTSKPKEYKKERTDRTAFVMDYLRNEVGFNPGQLARYDSLSKQHREQIKSTFKELSTERKDILSVLAAASFSDSAINTAANSLHDRQKVLELNMLKHVRDIRDICTEAQRPRFDTGFYKIFRKRGEAHKEK